MDDKVQEIIDELGAEGRRCPLAHRCNNTVCYHIRKHKYCHACDKGPNSPEMTGACIGNGTVCVPLES